MDVAVGMMQGEAGFNYYRREKPESEYRIILVELIPLCIGKEGEYVMINVRGTM